MVQICKNSNCMSFYLVRSQAAEGPPGRLGGTTVGSKRHNKRRTTLVTTTIWSAHPEVQRVLEQEASRCNSHRFGFGTSPKCSEGLYSNTKSVSLLVNGIIVFRSNCSRYLSLFYYQFWLMVKGKQNIKANCILEDFISVIKVFNNNKMKLYRVIVNDSKPRDQVCSGNEICYVTRSRWDHILLGERQSNINMFI